MKEKKLKKWLEDHNKDIGNVAIIVAIAAGACYYGMKRTETNYKPLLDELKKLHNDLGCKEGGFILKIDNAEAFDAIVGVIGRNREKMISKSLGADLYDTTMSIVFTK